MLKLLVSHRAVQQPIEMEIAQIIQAVTIK